MIKRSYYVLALFSIGVWGCHEEKKQPDGPTACDVLKVSFSKDIRLIIDSSCMYSGCHVSGASMGDFSTYAVIKAKIDSGKFRKRVLDLKAMPPVTKDPLTEEELQKISCWLDAGAPEN